MAPASRPPVAVSVCTAIVLLSTLPGRAELADQTLLPDETAVLARLISSACIDLVDEHTGCEQVILLQSTTEPDRADLVILTDWRTDPPSAPLLVARNIVFNGAMWGMAPSLAEADNGSLLLNSEQSGIGRFPWFETLTLAWRDGAFVVAGFSYSTYDRALGGHMSCDVDLLTGGYTVDATGYDSEGLAEFPLLDEAGIGESLRIAAEDWSAAGVFPAACIAGQAAIADRR